MVDLAFVGVVIITVFALVDPVGALPFFVALTEGYGSADRELVVRRSVLVSAGTLGLFALLGRFLFAAFALTLAAFEIAGGILLFLVAYDMLMGELPRTKLAEADRRAALERRDEIGVVPLGIPLLAGPGAISAVMIYEGSSGGDPLRTAATFLALAIIATATYGILSYGARILRRIGSVGVNALARVLGILLAAVGVQFVINGLGALGVLH